MSMRPLVLLALVLAIVLGPATVRAAETALVAAEAAVYQEVSLIDVRATLAGGLVASATVEGKVFVVVDAKLQITWDAKTRSVSVKAKDVSLILGEGKDVPMIGVVNGGHVRTSLASIFISRPFSFPKEKSSTRRVTCVFLVPAGTKQATLKMGSATQAVALGEPKPRLTLSGVPEVKVTGAKYVDSIPKKVKVAGEEFVTTLTPVAGKAIEVKLSLLPSGPNTGRTSFFFETRWLGVRFTVGGKPSHVVAAGQIGYSGFSFNASNSTSPSLRTKKWSAKRFTLYFVVPEGASDLKLTYLTQPVADVAVAP